MRVCSFVCCGDVGLVPQATIPQLPLNVCVADGEMLDKPLHIHRLSAYLVGRERKIADIAVDHPSCSSQHAVIQYRLIEVATSNIEGVASTRVVKPYLMDLESTNGTYLNGKRLDPARYYELRAKDIMKFGLSSREYVLVPEE